MPDWRDAPAYAPLALADRSLIAWEWLRRDPVYLRSSSDQLAGEPPGAGPPYFPPQHFGLVAFERAHRTVPVARPMWRICVHPYVLRAVRGEAALPQDEFDLDRLARLVTLETGGGEYLLLSDGLRSIRLDAPPGTFTRGPSRYASC